MSDRVVLHRDEPATLEPERADNGHVRATVARRKGVVHIGDSATPREVDEAIHHASSEGGPLPRTVRRFRRRRYQ